MAKRLSTEEKLAQLSQLQTRPLSEADIKELKKALSGPNNLVVAKAAKVSAACHLDTLIPTLVAAFERFMQKPAKADQRCYAKTALIEALESLNCFHCAVFLQGIHHIQMEAVFGGQEDTAATLRADCAIALAKQEYPDVFFELVPLLTDLEFQPRVAAIKALTYLNEEKSELLLRFKVLSGDDEPQVLGECFAGLMSIAPERSMPFVAQYLQNPEPMLVEGAALALGESRSSQALKLLQALWEDTLDQELKKLLLLPIALNRSDAAFEFLLDVVACEYRDYAAAAVKALRVCSDTDEQQEKIRHIVKARNDALVTDVYRQKFVS